MHRIRGKQGAQPFFLQHGLVDSSAGYVIMGPNISLGKFSPVSVLFLYICIYILNIKLKNKNENKLCLKNEFNA